MVNKISELWVKDLPDHIKEYLNCPPFTYIATIEAVLMLGALPVFAEIDLVRSIDDMYGLTQVFWIQYGLQNVNNYGVVSLKPSYAIRYEERNPHYYTEKSSGTRYIYQSDVGWDKLDSLYKELMREEKLNKLGI